MTTLGDRMRWTPDTPAPPLDLADVLAMLGVVDESEDVQRQRAVEAATRGDLGRPSLEALRRAGWIAEAPLPTVSGSEGLPTLLDLAITSLDDWKHLASERQRFTADAQARTRSRQWIVRTLFAVCVTGSAAILVLVGNDVIRSSVAASLSAVVGALVTVLAAERWNDAARQHEHLAEATRRLVALQLEIDEARWKLAADRRPEAIETTMERLRREYEEAMRADSDGPQVPTAVD